MPSHPVFCDTSRVNLCGRPSIVFRFKLAGFQFYFSRCLWRLCVLKLRFSLLGYLERFTQVEYGLKLGILLHLFITFFFLSRTKELLLKLFSCAW